MKDAHCTDLSLQRTGLFGDQVLYTEEFLTVWFKLPSQKQRIIHKKVDLLVTNPRHPSLQVHRLKRADRAVWDCYLIDSWPHRLLFMYLEGKILLVQMGSHRVVNRCHATKFDGKLQRSQHSCSRMSDA